MPSSTSLLINITRILRAAGLYLAGAGALALALALALLAAGCDSPLSQSDVVEQTAAPTADAALSTVAKSDTMQNAVTFTLSAAADGLWRVYNAAQGSTENHLVNTVYDTEGEGGLLTLFVYGSNLAEGVYWVTSTAKGKAESERLGLTVGPYTAPDQTLTPTAYAGERVQSKSAETQKAVTFQLASAHTGEWRVYPWETGGQVVEGVSASFDTDNKTLTLTSSEADLPAAVYWVRVTEAFMRESWPLSLTVRPYTGPGQTAAPELEGSNTVELQSENQTTVIFHLSSGVRGEWRAYAAPSGGAPLEVRVIFDSNEMTVSLVSGGQSLPGGVYYVAVRESGKTESGRLALHVKPWQPLPPSETPEAEEQNKTVTARGAVTFADFTLSAAAEGLWKVYGAKDDEDTLAGMAASLEHITKKLTLRAKGADLPAGTYWVSVTESGKTESRRLALHVGQAAARGGAAVPSFTRHAGEAQKEAAVQKSAVFSLASAPEGEWKVYAAPEKDEALDSVGAYLVGGKSGEGGNRALLTLAAAGEDLAPGTYWVSVTTPDGVESRRAALRLYPFQQPWQTGAPHAELAERVTVKHDDTQGEAAFTLASEVDGEWKVYAAETGGEPLETVDADFVRVSRVLRVENTAGYLHAGPYWVSVTEEGKAESARLALRFALAPARTFAFTLKDDEGTAPDYGSFDRALGALAFRVLDAENAAALEWSLDGAAAASEGAVCVVDLTALADGPHTIQVQGGADDFNLAQERVFAVGKKTK